MKSLFKEGHAIEIDVYQNVQISEFFCELNPDFFERISEDF
jgi:hypothetical protein